MPKLDLYKKRNHYTIKLNDGVEYKIPNEYTVEEVERLLELKTLENVIKATEVSDDKEEQENQLKVFWSNIFDQLEIIFQSYQPEINKEYLKKHVTHKEALEIVGFFQEYRALAMDNGSAFQSNSKKKVQS
jgi:hypothetical protein